MKKYIVGGLVGAALMFSAQGFAADAIEKVEAYIKNQPVKLNGQAVKLDSPVLVYDGSTYMKLRDAAKLTGLAVNYNEQTQTVELSGTSGTSPQAKAQEVTPQVQAATETIQPAHASGENKYNPNNPQVADEYKVISAIIYDKKHVFKYDGKTNTIQFIMDEVEYSAYKNIKIRETQILFISKLVGTFGDTYRNELSKYLDDPSMSLSFVYNDKVVLKIDNLALNGDPDLNIK